MLKIIKKNINIPQFLDFCRIFFIEKNYIKIQSFEISKVFTTKKDQ